MRILSTCVLLVSSLGCGTDSGRDLPKTSELVDAGFEAEHARLVMIEHRSPSQQAQLMLWQACKDHGYSHAGVDVATCEFVDTPVLPVQCRWTYDRTCSSCQLQIKWDDRYKGEDQIRTALMKVMYEHSFLTMIDLPKLIDEFLRTDNVSKEASPLNNKAVFYVRSRRLSNNELSISFSALPLDFSAAR